MNLASILEETARSHPLRHSIVSDKIRLSYRRLNLLSNQLASYFVKEVHLKEQGKIAILHENSINYLIVLFAIAKAGMVSVPINTFLKREEIIYILDDCQAEVLVISSNYKDILEEVKKRNTTIKQIIITDKKIEGYLFLDDLMDRDCSHNINEIRDENNIALISYTSSTTGSPKGVMLTHKNIISNVNSCLKAIEIRSKDCFLLLLPMFHSFTLTVSVFLPVASGSRLIILSSIKPVKRIIKSIIFGRVTILIGIPQVFRIFAHIRLPRIYSILSFLNPLRLAVSGADALDKDDAVEFMKKYRIKLLEGYGLTEASPVVSINPINGENRLGSVGLPLPGVEVKVVDEEENELPPGQIGELIVKGPNVMIGYYRREYETKEALRGNWLFTGDMAKIDKDGYIWIAGRKKDMIISHGMNIYPKEIEEILIKHPKVKDAAVIGKPDKFRGEVPLAFIVPEEGESISPKEIIEFCKEHLANYKVPHTVKIKDKLPKTPTGKVLKRILKELI